MPDLTPEELAEERKAWRERERKRREKKDRESEAKSKVHPWKKRRSATSAGRSSLRHDYVPPGESGLDRKWW